MACGMWNLSSLTKEWTHIPCSGSTLDCQRCPMLFPFYRWRKLSPGEVSNLATQLINRREETRILIHLTPKPKLLAILLPVHSLTISPASKTSQRRHASIYTWPALNKSRWSWKIPKFIHLSGSSWIEWKPHAEASPPHAYPNLPKVNPAGFS